MNGMCQTDHLGISLCKVRQMLVLGQRLGLRLYRARARAKVNVSFCDFLHQEIAKFYWHSKFCGSCFLFANQLSKILQAIQLRPQNIDF